MEYFGYLVIQIVKIQISDFRSRSMGDEGRDVRENEPIIYRQQTFTLKIFILGEKNNGIWSFLGENTILVLCQDSYNIPYYENVQIFENSMYLVSHRFLSDFCIF